MAGLLLSVGADGRITGPASITYNTPFPCVNGRYGSGSMQGVVMHTMVGDLPFAVARFNDPTAQVSAHFGIDQSGNIHQFGPIGKGWIAWAEEAGNDNWYSIEHADAGNTHNPLTQAQILASAQLVQCLSAFAGFPLQVTDSVSGQGYGTHVMGGAAWGGHTCPGPGPRAAQRYEIVALAVLMQTIPAVSVTTDGTLSLLQLAAARQTSASAILQLTAVYDGGYAAGVAAYINCGDLTAPMPAGLVLMIPG